jgi:hypothetical protein
LHDRSAQKQNPEEQLQQTQSNRDPKRNDRDGPNSNQKPRVNRVVLAFDCFGHAVILATNRSRFASTPTLGRRGCAGREF